MKIQAHPSLPAVEQSIVPLDGPALRGAGYAIEFDGGSFLLRIFDNREDSEPRAEQVATKRRNVEIARFSMAPLALADLIAQAEMARRSYKVAMGSDLPERQAVLKALTDLVLAEKAKAEEKAKAAKK